MLLVCYLTVFNGVSLASLNTQGQWSSVADTLPAGSHLNALTTFQNKLYAAGGDNTNRAYVYLFNGNVAKPFWTSVINDLKATKINIFLTFNENLYAGGYICSDVCNAYIATYNKDDQHPAWTPFSTNGLPQGAIITKLIEFNGKFVALIDHSVISPSIPNDPIYMYDEENKSWLSITKDFPKNLNDIVVFHNKLYACGGEAGLAGAVVYVYGESLSPKLSPSWTLIKNGLPDGNKSLQNMVTASANALVVFNDALFVGGRNETDRRSKGFVFAYNGDDNAPNWINKTDGLPFDISDGHYSDSEVNQFIVNNNTLYATGVDSGGDLFAYYLTSQASNWLSAGKGPAHIGWPSKVTTLSILNNMLYIGGYEADKLLACAVSQL